jgi:hypothetical protein
MSRLVHSSRPRNLARTFSLIAKNLVKIQFLRRKPVRTADRVTGWMIIFRANLTCHLQDEYADPAREYRQENATKRFLPPFVYLFTHGRREHHRLFTRADGVPATGPSSKKYPQPLDNDSKCRIMGYNSRMVNHSALWKQNLVTFDDALRVSACHA